MLLLLALIAALLEALAVIMTRGEVPVSGTLGWCLGGALGAELLAARLPSFGRVSLGTPFFLIMICQPGGVIVATIAAGGVALLRSMTPQGWMRQALGEWLPIVFVGFCRPFVPAAPWLQLLILAHLQLGAFLFVRRALAHDELDERAAEGWRAIMMTLAPPLLGLAWLTLPLGLLAAAHPSYVLLGLPVLLAVRAAVMAAPLLVREREMDTMRLQMAVTQLGLDKARQDREQARLELLKKTEQLALVEGLAASLARGPNLFDVLERVLETAQRWSDCQSAVMFAPEGTRLTPQCYLSPQSQRLAAADAFSWNEPLVEEAWTRSTAVNLREDHDSSHRLMQGESMAVAFPLENLGVIYLGDSARPPLTDEEMHMLRVLVAQAALSLQCARYFAQLQESLREYRLANSNLQRWGDGLGRVLDSAQSLTTVLDVSGLMQRLQEAVRKVLPAELVWVVSDDEEVRWYPPPFSRRESGPVEQLASRMGGEGQALLLDDALRAGLSMPGLRSLVACPIVHAGQVMGTVVACSSKPAAFDRLDRDLLSVLALEVAAALQNARQHQAVVEAYTKLQESESQLIQSGKMAAVGQLAAGVAHELNTPLGAIVLGIDSAMVQLEKRPERARERLSDAYQAATKAQAIVARLLYYSREGRQDHQCFDLNEVVNDTLQMLRHQLKLDGVEVVSTAAAVPPVSGSPNEIQQVITNLLLNARDALGEAPGATKAIQIVTRPEAGLSIVEVIDRGAGMTPEVQSRIFEPFFTTKPVGKGTGLGLSLSHQIVQQHGGTLTVWSQVGVGTRFTLSLPSLKEEADV